MSRSDLPAIRLLLDQGVPADAAPMFRQLGYECRHVSELGMQKAEDEEILSFAREQGCVVIALDADFHALIAVGGLKAPSVVRLRREGCKAEAAFCVTTACGTSDAEETGLIICVLTPVFRIDQSAGTFEFMNNLSSAGFSGVILFAGGQIGSKWPTSEDCPYLGAETALPPIPS